MVTMEEMREAVNTRLWIRHSFLAMIATSIGIEWVDDETNEHFGWCSKDGITINWNPIKNKKEFEGMGLENFLFIICHEVGHLLNCTFERENGRDKDLWNMATDYSINESLINNEVNHTPKPIGQMYYSQELVSAENPKGQAWLYDEKYKNKTCEEIYELLMQDFKNEHGGKTPQELREQLGKAADKAFDDWKKKQTKGQGQFDTHDGMSDMDEGTKNEIKAKVQQAMDTAQEKDCSKLDSMLSRALEFLFQEPPFDWRGFLNTYLKAFIKSDFSWKRPARRSWGAGSILPGSNVESHINFGVAIDTSGSMGQDEVSQILAHIQKIMHSFKSFDIDIWCFSTQVHEKTLKHYTKINQNNIKDYQLESFGGTEIESNFKWIQEQKKKYDVFICMTDGYDNIDGLQFKSCPVIWGITGNDNFKNPSGVQNAKIMRLEF